MDLHSRVTVEMHTDTELLLILAKAGSSPALVRLLDRYRDPLVQQAQGHLGRRLRVKLDVEDLLQDVSLHAHRDIRGFRGNTEREFLCWLRNILARILMNHLRHYFSPRGATCVANSRSSTGMSQPEAGRSIRSRPTHRPASGP